MGLFPWRRVNPSGVWARWAFSYGGMKQCYAASVDVLLTVVGAKDNNPLTVFVSC